jgi:hypothetical protein
LHQKLLLLRDDHVLDLVICGLGDDLLLHQIGLLGIRSAIDDLLGISGPDTRKGVELFLGRTVNGLAAEAACAAGALAVADALG